MSLVDTIGPRGPAKLTVLETGLPKSWPQHGLGAMLCFFL